MDVSELEYLKGNPFKEVKWGAEDRPAIIIDGKLFSIADLKQSRIKGQRAYIVGAKNKNFEQICTGIEVRTLFFYNMQVEDISPLNQINGLEHLSIHWNTKIKSLEDLKLNSLKSLLLTDTPKISSLEPLSSLKLLEVFEFSGGIWNQNRANTLNPIIGLNELHDLTLTNVKIDDDSLQPIVKCQKLKTLSLSNQFPTEEYAYIKAKRPDIECNQLKAYIELNQEIDDKNVMVIGRRKPFLNKETDAEKLSSYVKKFDKLVQTFASESK